LGQLTLTIPCEDCKAETDGLSDLGFRVTGCVPIADRPGMCRLTYEADTGTTGPAASAAAATPAAGPTIAAGAKPSKPKTKTKKPSKPKPK
jgi:hypothetical protein